MFKNKCITLRYCSRGSERVTTISVAPKMAPPRKKNRLLKSSLNATALPVGRGPYAWGSRVADCAPVWS